mgnify:FL=1|jgi:hypothetical protein
MLSESIKTFRQPVYVRTKRNTESYSATTEFITSNLVRLTKLYKVSSGLQRLRLIRDEMDHNLRRYHGYTIKGSIGSHYKQSGITKGIFEHMVPASTIRDLVLAEVITPKQACNMPTCTLSKENDQLLKDAGWNSKTPDIYNFWKRYRYSFETENCFETYDGTAILTSEWTLDNHFDYFG